MPLVTNNIARDAALDGATNMARDMDLLHEAESGNSGVRIYEWDGAWVSLGRFQSPERDLLEPELIPWVMRPTGGKAVLHGHDLTVTIASPLNAIGERSLKAVYRRIIRPLVEALNSAGQDAALGEETEFASQGKSADCFRHVALNDVVDPNTGRKLIGCALRVTRNAVLAQCSIPLAMPLIDPARVYSNAHVAMPLAIDKHTLAEHITGQFG